MIDDGEAVLDVDDFEQEFGEPSWSGFVEAAVAARTARRVAAGLPAVPGFEASSRTGADR